MRRAVGQRVAWAAAAAALGYSSAVKSAMRTATTTEDPNKPWTKLDSMVADEFDASLFEDPTSGMRLGQAEELSSEEMEHRVKVLATKYDPVIFTTVFMPIVDIIELMLRHRLIPVIRPEVAISRWFTDPLQLFVDSSKIAAAMSEERWTKYKEIVADLAKELLPTSPVYRIAKKYDLCLEIAVPLIRQLGAEVAYLADRKSSSLSQVPQFVLSLNSGKAPAALLLPSDGVRRTRCVTELLVAAGQEVGQPVLGFLGLQLTQAAGIEVDYSLQKRMTNVFNAAHRIRTDWDMRSTGRLLQAFPAWVNSYFKLLRQDNKKLELEGFVMDTYTTATEPRADEETKPQGDDIAVPEGVEPDRAAVDEDVDGSQSANSSPSTRSIDSYFSHKQGAPSDFFTSDQLAKIISESVAKKASLQAPQLPRSRYAQGNVLKSMKTLKKKAVDAAKVEAVAKSKANGIHQGKKR